jgi:serine/threonine-protein kinase
MCLACNKEYAGDMQICPDDKTSLIAIGREDPYLGKVLADRFDIIDIIGKGGMGVVYLAKHQVLDRMVAIKMLQAELTQDDSSVKRFQQEAKAASHLNHPHLISLYDFGVTPPPENQPFLVMEYLEGKSLLDVLREEGPMEPKRAVKIFSEAADGLHHAHTVGILHRDLKPSNILLINHQGDRDFVKIVDFGLAKLMPWSGKESQHLTKTGEVFGSPIYMSPEQCMGKELRPTSDIYSLGITLFECLTGKPPFRGANSIQTASKHMSDPPPSFREVRPDLPLPEGLEKVVMKCLAKNTQDRFQNMADFKDALIAGLNTEQVELPASLMVSTRAIPAVSAQMAAAQSAVRKAAVQPAPEPPAEPKKPPYAAIFGGIGALALAGIAAFCFLPVAGQSTGNISYYELNDKGGLVHVLSGNDLRVFKIGPDVPAMMSDNAADNCLGSMVDVQFNHARFENANTGTLTRLAFKPTGKPDEVPKAAVTKVDDFLNDVASNWQDRVNQLYKPGLGADFQRENKISWKYIPQKKTDNSYRQSIVGATSGGHMESEPAPPNDANTPKPRQGDQPYDFDSRPAHAYKLAKDADGKYRVLVDGFSFTTQDPAPFWQFDVTMDGETAQITGYKKIDEATWNTL